MYFSQTLIPTLREAPADAEVTSHQLMLRAGYIRKVAAGIYAYLPLGVRVISKISNIIREEMNKSGAAEVTLPIVTPAELWQESARWDAYGKELLRFKDRHDRDFCMGPTHEEVITDLVRKNVSSYRQLPLNLYQIQTKFRDEIRPRFGLMRGREFLMKDAYSFDLDETRALETYQKMYEAYKRIFKRCGLAFRPVEAATGAIGGSYSHEFQVLAASGEDAILSCNACDYAANIEKAETRPSVDLKARGPEATPIAGDPCPRCEPGRLESFRGIEVGQVFYLGTKYSEALRAVYLDEKGKEQIIAMGCYGIGVSRTAAAAIEQNHDAAGIIWPKAIAPFSIEILPLKPGDPNIRLVTEQFATELESKGIDVLVDDREESPGVKFKDADLIGIPYRLILSPKGIAEKQAELKDRKTGEVIYVPLENAVETIERLIQETTDGR